MSSIYITVINDLVSDARAHRTCITLRKSGADVTLIGRKLKNSPETGQRDYHTKRFRMSINKGFLFYLFYNLRLFLFLLTREKGSIVVSCDLDTLPAGFLASKLRGYRLVYDSHEYFTEVPELQNRKFVRNIWLMLERYLIPRLKHAYTVSEPIAEEYSAMYGAKFEVVRNLPIKKKVDGIYPIPNTFSTKKKIIYQGAVNIGRGIEEMMETVKLMDDVVFIIAGDGDIFDSLEKKAEAENLRDRVFFTGRIPFDKLHELTVQGDIGISMERDLGKNYRYALPNKLFDYFHAGIPVLVSPLPMLREIVEKYGTGLVAESPDPEYLKEKLEYMLYNDDARKTWKINLAIAAKELCWEQEENKLKEIFTNVGLTFA